MKISTTADKVMDIAIRHWKGSFTGVSSLDVSREIGASHDSVIQVFDELERQGLATLNRNVRGVSISLPLVPVTSREEPKEVVHTILFPSKEMLTEVLERSRIDYGPYLNRLHKGESQVALCYFKTEVLRKYADQQEKYHFDDSDMEGWVATKDTYCLSLAEETRDEETVTSVRYGKRQLAGGGLAITAILKDLAALPYKEQLYWCSFEIEQPVFDNRDPTFDKWVKENFGGEFVDHEDPIQTVYDNIERINSLFTPEVLFIVKIPNPHLQYPVLNNRKAYNDAHQELAKVIGLDSRKKLNMSLIGRLLAMLNQPTATQKGEGAWSKFRRLVAGLLPGNHDGVLRPLENCRSARQEAAHDVEQPELSTTDLRELFKSDCKDVATSLAIIHNALARIWQQKE